MNIDLPLALGIISYVVVVFYFITKSRDKRKDEFESYRYIKKMPDLYAQIKDGKIEYTLIDDWDEEERKE